LLRKAALEAVDDNPDNDDAAARAFIKKIARRPVLVNEMLRDAEFRAAIEAMIETKSKARLSDND
jgi:hypothetical protein